MHYSSREPTGDTSTAPLKGTDVTPAATGARTGSRLWACGVEGKSRTGASPKPTRSRRSGAGVAAPETFREQPRGRTVGMPSSLARLDTCLRGGAGKMPPDILAGQPMPSPPACGRRVSRDPGRTIRRNFSTLTWGFSSKTGFIFLIFLIRSVTYYLGTRRKKLQSRKPSLFHG